MCVCRGRINMEIKELRESTGMNRKEFCEYFEIPYRIVTEWERGTRKKCQDSYSKMWTGRGNRDEEKN